ncbi:MAG: hydrogenase formation protein HypD [Bacillota bacterium]
MVVDRAVWDRFRDPRVARGLVARIRERVARELGGHVALMEVCGTHTVAISRTGIRSALRDAVTLVSGPGCPVCVTSAGDVDAMVTLAASGLTVFTFGDMMRVPGSSASLEAVRAQGGRVRLAYSPLDGVLYAASRRDEEVVFLAVGFETTAPGVALALVQARRLGLANFSIYPAHKLIPPALRALLDQGEANVSGFLLPGHVSTVIGRRALSFLAEEYGVPAVIAGFEPVDILMAIDRLTGMMASGEVGVVNMYPRAVREEGNPLAQQAMWSCFEPVDATWRGLGMIGGSGLDLRASWLDFDARRRYGVEAREPAAARSGCRCGDVLRGSLLPPCCPLFARVCTPASPQGPCMVSSEGACAAYFRYERGDDGDRQGEGAGAPGPR